MSLSTLVIASFRPARNSFKTSWVLGLLALCGTAMAQEQGRVISSTPVVSQVGVPRQVCSQQQVQVQAPKSGLGVIMGGIAGGAIGSNVGGGDGRALATAIGLIGGAMLGDRMEGASPAQTQNVQNCTTQTFYENRTTAYNVVYEFNGKQYSVQMPQDPGPFVRLQVTPVAGSASGVQGAPQSGATTQIQQDAGQPLSVAPAQPVYVQPAPVVTQQIITQPVYASPVVIAAAPAVVYAYPGYPGYYARPYYPPVGVSLNLGWRAGHRHWR